MGENKSWIINTLKIPSKLALKRIVITKTHIIDTIYLLIEVQRK
jgi:hypothetical protein